MPRQHPESVITAYERVYPFAWLGILAESAPAADELVYAHSERGFALLSMRSPTLSRLYVQCAPDDDLADWPDARVWKNCRRGRRSATAGFGVPDGPVLQKGIAGMRSFVAEPMQFGRLYLAGDAAHIVPPTGAKGMNPRGRGCPLPDRGAGVVRPRRRVAARRAIRRAACKRVWKAQRFSWWMTTMLHLHPGDTSSTAGGRSPNSTTPPPRARR